MSTSSQLLRGACACGRNQYTVLIPPDAQPVNGPIRVLLDNSPEHRHALSHPLPMYLRTPLSHYSSFTQAFFPDETHSLIRRVFSSPLRPDSRRVFCGYCGSSLSYWSDVPRTESDFIWVPLGSLMGDALTALEELGYLDEFAEADLPETTTTTTVDRPSRSVAESTLPHHVDIGAVSRGAGQRQTGRVVHNGAPWFEEMVEGSALGRLIRRRGGQESRDGSTSVEWEVLEWTNDDDDETKPPTGTATPNSGKRKIGEVEGAASEADTVDVTMRGAL